jgi:hypothetical protein
VAKQKMNSLLIHPIRQSETDIKHGGETVLENENAQ